MSSYTTIEGRAVAEIEEKKSRFIASLAHVETEEEALEFLEEIRAANRMARHNVYAYILRQGGAGAAGRVRYSDDGEPQKTAGLPTLEVLQHAGLTDVVCVVTRYFGGVLLGTGGLVRAYTKSAQLGLEAAGINQMSSYSVLLITCPYSLLGVVQNILPEHDCMADDIEYAADVTLTVTLPEGGEEALAAALRDATSAAVDVEVMESRFMGRRLR